jgi:hypothetical protein
MDLDLGKMRSYAICERNLIYHKAHKLRERMINTRIPCYSRLEKIKCCRERKLETQRKRITVAWAEDLHPLQNAPNGCIYAIIIFSK